MILKIPRTAWEWLVILSPAVAMVIFGTAVPSLVIAMKNDAHPDRFGISANWGILGLAIGAAMSLGLGFWLTRGEVPWSRRCGEAMCYGIVIEFLNLSIAFGGCMAVGAASSALSR